MENNQLKKDKEYWRARLYRIIFKSDTREGRMFDFRLLVAIVISIVAVMLDSIPEAHAGYGKLFRTLEWGFTILFTIEYVVRIWVMGEKKWSYILSFLGIIDLLSVLPTYLGIFFEGYQYLLVLRSLRLLRIFRIFKLWHYLRDTKVILDVLYASYRKITVFMFFIAIVALIIGSLMYLIEDGNPGFSSIPDSIYWAVVTITTVGYGDVSPVTGTGRLFAVLLMLCGYAIIAVPTGILTSEMVSFFDKDEKEKKRQACPRCGAVGHNREARYCWKCGEFLLNPNSRGNTVASEEDAE